MNSADIDEVRLEFQPLPRKPLLLSVLLLVIGVGLIVVGFVEEAVDVDPTRGIAFWILGSLTLIPGAYFSYQFFKAWRAKTPAERREILEEFPNA